MQKNEGNKQNIKEGEFIGNAIERAVKYLDDGDTLYDAIKYLGVNLITVDLKCLDKSVIDDIGGVCIFDRENTDTEEYKEASKIYKDLLKHMDLIYETDRYRLYYVGD